MRLGRFCIVFAPAVLVAFCIGVMRIQAAVTTISPVFQDPVTSRQYQLLSNANWTDSQAAAQSLGGNLVTISTQEQQNFVFGLFGGYGGVQRILWTGLYDASQDSGGGTHTSNFHWVSGAPVTYTNWAAGQPDNTGSAEFWVAMYYPNFNNPGSWNDWTNRTSDPIGVPFFGVVEYVPEPTVLSMCCLGSLLLMPRRR